MIFEAIAIAVFIKTAMDGGLGSKKPSVPAPEPDKSKRPNEADASYVYRRIKEEGGEVRVLHSRELRENARIQSALGELVKCGCVEESDVTENYKRPHINPSTQNWDMKWDERSVATRYRIVR